MSFDLNNADGVLKTLGCYVYTDEMELVRADPVPAFAMNGGRSFSVRLRSFGHSLARLAELLAHLFMRCFYYLAGDNTNSLIHREKADRAAAYWSFYTVTAIGTRGEQNEMLCRLAITLLADKLSKGAAKDDHMVELVRNSLNGTWNLCYGLVQNALGIALDENAMLAKGSKECFNYISKNKNHIEWIPDPVL